MHITSAPRCAAAHDDDTRACVGATDAVRVIDQTGDEATGCVLHAAVAAASLADARLAAGREPGAAIAAYHLARELPPYAWHGRRAPARAAQLRDVHVSAADPRQHQPTPTLF